MVLVPNLQYALTLLLVSTGGCGVSFLNMFHAPHLKYEEPMPNASIPKCRVSKSVCMQVYVHLNPDPMGNANGSLARKLFQRPPWNTCHVIVWLQVRSHTFHPHPPASRSASNHCASQPTRGSSAIRRGRLLDKACQRHQRHTLPWYAHLVRTQPKIAHCWEMLFNLRTTPCVCQEPQE